MNLQKDFCQLDEADIRLIINDTDEIEKWTGKGDELPPAEFFTHAKKVLLKITTSSYFTAEDLNSTLDAIRCKLPEDALFLYTIVSDKTEYATHLKRMEITLSHKSFIQ